MVAKSSDWEHLNDVVRLVFNCDHWGSNACVHRDDRQANEADETLDGNNPRCAQRCNYRRNLDGWNWVVAMSRTYPVGTAEVIKANALELPLPNESVDLVITSPPYFALRSYRDDGEHYGGQIGSEATPSEFIDALIAATREMMRVLKPSGSIWVNLGDKYAGSGGHNNAGISNKSTLSGNGHTGGVGKAGPQKIKATLRSAPDSYNKASDGVRSKSLMGLPWRYAIRCIDELGLILRAEVIWSKPNGLPESVRDRVRRSHEQWFHFVKLPTYFAGIDEVREAHTGHRGNDSKPAASSNSGTNHRALARNMDLFNPLGKLPGSVWTVPTEPLKVPAHLGVDHFAAFPTAWPSRIIQGWSPIPAVVLDPFGGTGTVAMVAKALGRHGISVDLSADYCRLAEWRTNDQKTLFKVRSKVYGEINRRRKRQRNERAAWQ